MGPVFCYFMLERVLIFPLFLKDPRKGHYFVFVWSTCAHAPTCAGRRHLSGLPPLSFPWVTLGSNSGCPVSITSTLTHHVIFLALEIRFCWVNSSWFSGGGCCCLWWQWRVIPVLLCSWGDRGVGTWYNAYFWR